MEKYSTGRRSSTIPVRVSQLDREEKATSRSDLRKTQTLKPKPSSSLSDVSHIPKVRHRTSSCDRQSNKASLLKAPGRTPIRHQYGQHVPVTPSTPRTNPSRVAPTSSGGSNRLHLGLPRGRRSQSADRASSLGTKSSRKDMRPLLDKLSQAEMLVKIDNYFHMHQLTGMLNNNGSLKPVTLKMFVEVSDNLLKTLDVKQHLTLANYVEELPKIAKKLYYPGNITKSWLKTANTMHSWPNVLVWICWLVEMVEVHHIALEKYSFENLPFVGTESEAELKKNTFYSMVNCYRAWNDEPQEEEALIEKYLGQIQQQEGASNQDLEQARLALKEEMQKFQAATEQSSKINNEVEQLEKELAALQKEELQQLADIKMNEDYVENTQAQIEQLEDDSAALSEQILSQTAHREELLQRIKEQPMSKAEKDKLLKECTEKESYIVQFNEHLEEMRNELYSLDMKQASINNTLIKYVLSYNKDIYMNLNNDVDIDLEDLKLPETGILQPEVVEMLNEKANLMHTLKDSLKKQLTEHQSSNQARSNELENLQEKIKDLQDTSDDIVNKTNEMKKSVIKMKTDANKEEIRLRDQIRALQSEIDAIQESMPNLQEVMSEIEEGGDKLEAVQRRKQYIEQTAKLFFDKFYEILNEHREQLCILLTKRNQADTKQ